MRAILVDAGRQVIEDVELPGEDPPPPGEGDDDEDGETPESARQAMAALAEMRRLVGCRTLTALFLDTGDGKRRVMYLDDDGLGAQRPLFSWAGYPQPLAGNGLLLDFDERGRELSCTLPLARAQALVIFRPGLEFTHMTTKTEDIPGWGAKISVLPHFKPKDE